MIKFISYNGKWPNLCSGTLVVEKDGKQYCCELCRYYGGGDEMECAHCDPMNI